MDTFNTIYGSTLGYSGAFDAFGSTAVAFQEFGKTAALASAEMIAFIETYNKKLKPHRRRKGLKSFRRTRSR